MLIAPVCAASVIILVTFPEDNVIDPAPLGMPKPLKLTDADPTDATLPNCAELIVAKYGASPSETVYVANEFLKSVSPGI